MLLLTGPTAAGKNTVGRLLALDRARCAVVDFDAIRAMFVQPHRAPWQGEEGLRQQRLGVRMASAVATHFASDGWEVVLLDVVDDKMLSLYRACLAPAPLAVVQLLPAFDELRRRFDARGPVLTEAELRQVYAGQQALRGADLRIDNSSLAPELCAARILSALGGRL